MILCFLAALRRGGGSWYYLAHDAAILYKCPQTGTNVQHWLADAPDDVKDAHSSVSCPACANIHFIHNSTGKLLGEK